MRQIKDAFAVVLMTNEIDIYMISEQQLSEIRACHHHHHHHHQVSSIKELDTCNIVDSENTTR